MATVCSLHLYFNPYVVTTQLISIGHSIHNLLPTLDRIKETQTLNGRGQARFVQWYLLLFSTMNMVDRSLLWECHRYVIGRFAFYLKVRDCSNIKKLLICSYYYYICMIYIIQYKFKRTFLSHFTHTHTKKDFIWTNLILVTFLIADQVGPITIVGYVIVTSSTNLFGTGLL